MGPEIKYSSTVDSETAIARIRSTLLILAQTGESSDLSFSQSTLAHLREQAENERRPKIVAAVSDCEAALGSLAADRSPSPTSVYTVLDRIASLEAALLDSSLHTDDFVDDLNSLVDASFDDIIPKNSAAKRPETFEIDEETLEIFRNEAADLLAAIEKSLNVLLGSPTNSNAIWEIRRCAHTFKGAAGIVGFKNACRIAHKMEDLLDAVVNSDRGAGPAVVEFLQTAVDALNCILAEKCAEEESVILQRQYTDAAASINLPGSVDANISNPSGQSNRSLSSDPGPATRDSTIVPSSPVVRVSIDRLTRLLEISGSLAANNAALAESLLSLVPVQQIDKDSQARLESLLDTARDLNKQLHAGIVRIRMVKFGTLETRLTRTVQSTCQDVNKKAILTLENGEVEIDTLLMDALVEPLLHLLKNAVVHGIETPEKRRLIGKPEAGSITVKIEADEEALILTISDDGGGISLARLKEKAVENALVTEISLSTMTDRDAYKLVFAQGLTTTDNIDLNAGRGVGMAIVKESVESRGGSVLINSETQKGTTFTILMPLTVTTPAPTDIDDILELAPASEPLAALILIVDDSSTIRNQAVKIIEDLGFRTITANNGAEALELLLSGKWEPDLILSDVEMPQIDGWQFLEYVKTDDNFGAIPMVMITSLDLPKYRKRALDLGAADYIVKPVQTSDLERVCRRYASKS